MRGSPGNLHNLRRVFEKGRDAALAGKTLDDCPYKPMPDEEARTYYPGNYREFARNRHIKYAAAWRKGFKSVAKAPQSPPAV